MVLVLYVRLLRLRSGRSSSNCCEVAVAVADDITGELLLLFSDDFCTCKQNVNIIVFFVLSCCHLVALRGIYP